MSSAVVIHHCLISSCSTVLALVAVILTILWHWPHRPKRLLLLFSYFPRPFSHPLTSLLPSPFSQFTLDGVARMRERPIIDLVDGLKQLGVDISCSDTGESREGG